MIPRPHRIGAIRKKPITTLRVLAEYYGITYAHMFNLLKAKGINRYDLVRDLFALIDFITANPPETFTPRKANRNKSTLQSKKNNI